MQAYRRYQSALRDYPLEPYLAYDELTHRLKSASNQEVEKFLAEHGDLPQINWMKLRWRACWPPAATGEPLPAITIRR